MRSRVAEAAHILGPVNGKTARERTPNTASASCHICASNASASDISGGSCREGFEPLQHGAAPFGREPSQIIRHCSVEQVFASDLHANIAVVDDEIKQSREFQLMPPAIPD
jgi:hypothetical protein